MNQGVVPGFAGNHFFVLLSICYCIANASNIVRCLGNFADV